MNDKSEMKPAPGFADNPDKQIELYPSPKRVRAVWRGQTVADSTKTLLMRESGTVPVYYFPLGDVRMDLCEDSDTRTYCPYKGEAVYFTLIHDGSRLNDALWRYPQPYAEMSGIRDYGAFYWTRMDHWYEEDEEVFVHARDPRKRVDVVLSHRPVEVVLDGHTLAASSNARFLFETGLPVRYYLPRGDVNMDLLRRSPSATSCPYKGDARYYSAVIGDDIYEDICWYYPEPVEECPKIRDMICFYHEKDAEIYIDGVKAGAGG